MDTSNYIHIAIISNFWGSGETANEAVKQMRRAGGGSQMTKHGYIVYRVHPDFTISNVDGSVFTPIGHPVVRVLDKRRRA
jgi:hypothetical protein